MLSELQHGAPPDVPASFNLAAYVLGVGEDARTALEMIGGAEPVRYSYADIRAAVFGAAAGLSAQDLPQGARILMRLGNTLDFPVCYLAAIAAGYVPIVTSSQLTQGEVDTIAAQTAPALAIQAPDVAGASNMPTLPLADFQTFYTRPGMRPVMGDPDRPAYIVFTSGTSGHPRAVVHAHRAILARQMMIRDWYDLHATDRLCHAGAFNWTFTLGTGLMDPWRMGATALILAPGTDPADLPALLAKHDVTVFAGAPGIFRQMLRHTEQITAPNLRHALAAGEKLPETLRTRWHAATQTDIHEAFGMSECSTFISGAPNRPAAPASLGQPQRGRHVAVIDAIGQPVPIGDEGDIAVHRGDFGLMLGYLNALDETNARFRGDWFVTGDRGVMAETGDITYLGRADDMMNAGGFRVSPVEVEHALAQHPNITECASVEQRVGPETTIIALAYTGTLTDPETLQAFAAHSLARYKQPRAWHHMPALPRGANGKLLRRAIRAQLESDL